MTDDALARVLALVADGRLTAEEAGPILDALERRAGSANPAAAAAPEPIRGQARFARIEVVEGGRKAVDLRVPLSLGRHALSAIPGLSSARAAEIDDAVSRGVLGPIVDIADGDGDGFRIVLE
jgi:hypothetical protein